MLLRKNGAFLGSISRRRAPADRRPPGTFVWTARGVQHVLFEMVLSGPPSRSLPEFSDLKHDSAGVRPLEVGKAKSA